MTGRHHLRERARLLDELHKIVQAMRNLAWGQLQRVSRELPALTQAREAVAGALWSLGQGDQAAVSGTSWLVIGSERGYCGAFNAQLAEATAALGEPPAVRTLLAGSRLSERLDGRGDRVLAGCAGVEEARPALEAWLRAAQAEAAAGREVWLLHQSAHGLVRRRLLPEPDLPQAPTDAAQGRLPAHYLPVPALRAGLRRQAVRLLLQEALYASLAQENHSRLAQMQLAQDHLEELGRELKRRKARLRQAEITGELEMLASTLLPA